MNKSTSKVLSAIKNEMTSVKFDSDSLNDVLNSIAGEVDVEEIDQSKLRTEIDQFLSRQAAKMANELITMVQQVYGI